MIDARAWYEDPRYIDHGGRRIFVRDEGDGEPILFLHGFPTSSWDWHALWPTLRARNRCVAFDFLGFGYSDKPRRHDYSIHEQADIAEAVIEHVGGRRLKLVAHDYGVTVAQELLARQHEGAGYSVESVVLFNGGLFPETHRARPIQTLMASRLGPLLNAVLGFRQFRASFARVFGPQTQPREAELRELWRVLDHPGGARCLHRLLHYIEDRRQHRERWVDALVRSPAPIRLVNGLVDPVSGGHLLARYREVVDASADVVPLPNIGHYPQLEDPAACLAAIEGFTAGGYGGALPVA